MAKQQQQIQMGAYFLNGRKYNNTTESRTNDYTPFDGYPLSYYIWNVNYTAEKEFLTSATSKSLTGFERGNPGGHRIKIDIALRNTTSTQTDAIKSLLDLVPSQYERTVVQSNVVAVVDATIDLNLADVAPYNVSNTLQGAYIRNTSNTSASTYRITDYVGTTKIATTTTNVVGYTAADNVNIALFPDKPTVVGVSVDNTTSNIIYCNLISSSLGINRELTVGNQIINMSLRSVERFQTIPDALAI